MISASQVLDNVMASLADNSAAMRGKCLVWLNGGMQLIASQRKWSFLSKRETITAVSGEFTYPADYAAMESITFGQTCLYANDQVSDEDQAKVVDRYYWVDNGTSFSVYPAVDGDVVLKYTQAIPSYTDTTTATLFPVEMLDVLVRYVLMRVYEYDFDERSGGSLMVYQQALKEAKKWDNTKRPLPKRNKRSIAWDNV